MLQTIARGIKTPIIKVNDKLDDIVVESIIKASTEGNFKLNDRDVIGITESVVSISLGNYATLDNIATDINDKFITDHLGIVFPILSRNRFSILLKAFAKAKKELTILLSYPYDEVGNGILDIATLTTLNINPYSDSFDETFYRKYFGNYLHPYTKINMVDYYKELVNELGTKVNFIFSNNPLDIAKYTNDVLVSDIHTRKKTKLILKTNKDLNVLGLDDILTKPVNGSGYNSDYGLLGTNAATNDTVKMFPDSSQDLLLSIQDKLFKLTNKKLEVMIYGDGAFKDPVTGIWELADPVVSPGFTSGLIGSPNEVKLKYLVETKFQNLQGKELEDAVSKVILEKSEDLKGQNISLGTTPRSYTDLLGSLCDLVSGSGDKGTPVVLIQNYFK